MSKKTYVIPRAPSYDVLREVYLNNGGVKIGEVVRWRYRAIAYLSKRKKEHYYIARQGFGLDKALFWKLVANDRVDWIIIEYEGVKGKRFFVSSVDDWVKHGEDIQHAKEIGDTITTYGAQKILGEKYMQELVIG